MAATDDVKLLGYWACPYVNRAQLALAMKSIDHVFIEDNPHDRSEMLLKYNPVHKKIPILVHAEKPVCESLIIVEYIDDVWASGPPIMPSEAYDRAMARFWTAYIDNKWYPLLKVLREKEEKEEQREIIEKVNEGLVLLEEAFISCSKGKTYFGGDNIGYIDIVLGSCLGWLRVTEKLFRVEFLDSTNTPGLAKWADSLFEDDVVKAVFPDTETF